VWFSVTDPLPKYTQVRMHSEGHYQSGSPAGVESAWAPGCRTYVADRYLAVDIRPEHSDNGARQSPFGRVYGDLQVDTTATAESGGLGPFQTTPPDSDESSGHDRGIRI